MKRMRLPLTLGLLLAAAWPAAGADGASLSAEERQVIETLIIGTPTERNINAALGFWRGAPEDLKQRILATPKERRWPIVLCHYLGFDSPSVAAARPERCEEKVQADTDRGAASWSNDGQWVGPTDDCRARNLRNEYGQLICD